MGPTRQRATPENPGKAPVQDAPQISNSNRFSVNSAASAKCMAPILGILEGDLPTLSLLFHCPWHRQHGRGASGLFLICSFTTTGFAGKTGKNTSVSAPG